MPREVNQNIYCIAMNPVCHRFVAQSGDWRPLHEAWPNPLRQFIIPWIHRVSDQLKRGRLQLRQYPFQKKAHRMPAQVARHEAYAQDWPFQLNTQPVPVFERRSLVAGQSFDGPAIVEERETTIVIPPGWRASVDQVGCVVASFVAKA